MRWSRSSPDLVVLNFGRKIVEGEPRSVMASDEVREIYMGIAA